MGIRELIWTLAAITPSAIGLFVLLMLALMAVQIIARGVKPPEER